MSASIKKLRQGRKEEKEEEPRETLRQRGFKNMRQTGGREGRGGEGRAGELKLISKQK